MRVLLLVILVALTAVRAREIPIASPEAFDEACRSAQPGDMLVLADGTWRDVELVFRARGTAEQPITLRAATPGRVILSGQSTLRLVGAHLVVDGLLFTRGSAASGHVVAFRGDSDEEATDCRLTNTAIIDYNPPDPATSSTKWVSIYGARNRVDHCFFKGKTDASQVLVVWLNGTPNDHRIDRNHFAGRPALGKNGGEIIRIGDSKTSMEVSRTTVEFNLFEDCDGEAEIVSNKSCGNVYRHNTFRRCAGALTLRHGNDCLVEANWFFGEGKEGSGGVRIIGENHRVLNNYFGDLEGEEFFSALGFMACIPDSAPSGYLQVKRAVVAFNTVVDCRSSLYFGIGAGSRGRILPAVDCVIANNVFSQTAHPLVTVRVAPVGTVWEGNVFSGPPGDLPEEAGGLRTGARLVRAAGGWWEPAPDSPARGAARGKFPGVTRDILGRERAHPADAGCFQGDADSGRFPPLTPAGVGPAWMRAPTAG